jgi:hypothetical protein
MSPASYLTAPPRDAASIVAPGSANRGFRSTIRGVIWAALAFCILAVVGSTAYAATRAWRLWRTFRGTARAAGEAIGRVSASAAAAEEHAVSLSVGSERLSRSSSRLQEALGELAVIRAAAAEPRGLAATIRGAVPRK